MRSALAASLAVALTAAAWSTGGCGSVWPRPASQPVPSPINLLLPKSIHVHPLTGGPRTFDNGTRGLEVQIAAKDAFGNSAKAFGEFTFELYDFQPNSIEPKGARLAVWEQTTLDASENLKFWDETRRMYEFRLQWDQIPGPGKKLVLVARFASPFTERLFSQYTFVTGE